MYSVQFLFRLAKAISVATIGLMSLLVFIGNTTDYFTNYRIVQHVLKMDTTFPGSHIHYRSINNLVLFHAVYIFIIILQGIMTCCCIKGSWQLFKNLRSGAAVFHASKNWAVAGIIVGIIIWFLGNCRGMVCHVAKPNLERVKRRRKNCELPGASAYPLELQRRGITRFFIKLVVTPPIAFSFPCS